jgi:hypothetical protein
MRRVKPYVYVGTFVLALVTGLGFLNPLTQADSERSLGPSFRVDPFWPKPLPDNWVTGEVAGTCIDSNDHVFIVNRGFQTGGLVSPEGVAGRPEKSKASPPAIEFDRAGNVVNSWGDPALNTAVQGTLAVGTNKVLPNGIHGCYVDYQDNVWIGGNGDGVVQKFTHKGVFLMQIGIKGECDNPPANTCGNSGSNPAANKSHTRLNQPPDIAVDPSNGDVYIADGYGNHRIVVFDKNGNYLRQWGSVGTGPGLFQPGDGGHPHCVVLGADGLVYACDRGSDRIQVFEKHPTSCANTGLGGEPVCQPVRIIPVVPCTGASGSAVCPGTGLGTAGSAWDLDFSRDKHQKFMFEVDGGNEVLWTFDRALGKILSGFGRPGHMAGDFTFLHSVSIDSTGDLYTGETIGGRRIQKFNKCKDDDDDNGHGCR